MKRVVQISVFLVAAVVAFFGVRALFPDDEVVIEKQLNEMTETASFSGELPPLAKVSKAGELMSFFAPTARIEIEPWGYPTIRIKGRAEIRDNTIGAMSSVSSLSLTISDMQITVADDRSTAQVFISVIANSSRQDRPVQQDFEIQMSRVDGDWLIDSIGDLEVFRQ